MFELFLAICCSVAIGMIFKHAGRQQMDRTALLTVNYAAAVGVALGLMAVGGRTMQEGLTIDGGLLTLAVATGALLIFGFFILSVATDEAGMALAIGVMRVAVVIPFVMSWLVWNEVPSWAQIVGLVLAGAAFFMIAWRKRAQPDPAPELKAASVTVSGASGGARGSGTTVPTPPSDLPALNWRVFGVLAILFVSGGAVDVSMKTFEETFGATNSRVLFLMLAFGVSFLIGLAIVLWKGWRTGNWPEGQTVRWGIGLGVINYGSLEFILRAIEQLPGTFVFPVNNIAVVILAAVIGVYWWRESLSRINRTGIGVAALALLLLNL